MLRRLNAKNGSQLMRTILWSSQSICSYNSFRTRFERLEASFSVPLHSSIIPKSHPYSQFSGFTNKASFEETCSETLESLTDRFEELLESSDHLQGADVNYSDGVLTVQLGEPHGTYVINRQSPNQQIWLSSPTSGPKRYDFIDGSWIYRHDGVSLHELLNKEIPGILGKEVDFKQCSYGQPFEK